ncbi:MAG: hypothetical protein ACD_2C00014G0007 [uncultured bacterium (gcode 4)]|uniref:YdhG-like domain-containing protein n=1 Tax=uncultured bacterium (gcode 4) TaxID=1234023 RepID=K2G4V1_9BACT|nr:MAG: hypothetical protein ACD_2C00014G0007 [uncultured bacterium (gcode 4)]
MNMFAENKAKSVEEYLKSVPEDRKGAIDFLHDFIQKSAPSLKPYFAYNMIGYGKFQYLDSKKQKLDWPVIALANQKNYISIYVCSISDGLYLAEKYEKELGKVSTGKSCIRFKKIEDVNLDTLKIILKSAESNPGLIGAVKS